jgi:HSP20 family molecular chaperone IbpA
MAQPAKNLEFHEETTPPAQLKLVPPSGPSKRAERQIEPIARRACEIFENNGVDIAESTNGLTVRAEVPDSTVNDLEALLEPRRLTITGKRHSKQDRDSASDDQLLRIIELPIAVDPGKAEATLRDGILELKMAKAARPRKLEITEETKVDEQC